jgi:N-acetylmuramoyl-L-alanine amidase
VIRFGAAAGKRSIWALALAALLLGLPAHPDGAPVDRFDVVVIDAGHGGHDKGARGPRGGLEKDVVLAVAEQLASDLRGHGLRVVMTRSGDRFVSLEERTHIANDARGDVFVSIHANAAKDARIHGIESFFLSLDATDDAARRLAERENDAFGKGTRIPAPSDDPMVAILGDMIANEHLHESQALARMAQERLTRRERGSSRGVKQAPFVVLSGVQMPATLVEIGFITNASEEKQLRSGRGRKAIVAALSEAVREYGRRYDARRGVRTAPASGAR